MKVKVITYRQLHDVLGKMLADGKRKPDEPFSLNGTYIEELVDRDGEKVIAVGEVEVDVKIKL